LDRAPPPKKAVAKLSSGRAANGEVTIITPTGFNARTRVHEYGGGDYAVAKGTIVFSNFADQRLYLHSKTHNRDR